MATGIRAIDGLLTLGEGQRVAIMAGSGVGKSTLLGMAARSSQAEVNVVCLVGERGREVREFLERDLGPEGLARSVVIVATSDRAPVLLVKAVQAALSVAEYFRDGGAKVMLMVDSLTRLAMAQRQIGLAAGEPPATRGYTPSVFTLLPRLLERAGPGEGRGSITAITTVLVEGDDMDDPVADTVRGIVDGHIVLSRKIASHGHYPAIDVLESVSRTMNMTSSPEHQSAARSMRDLIATWRENEELIRLGAYRRGTDPKVDRAILLRDDIDGFLRQDVEDITSFKKTVESVIRIADRPDPTRRPQQ
jgi:flagellum-specific ATP synthase